MPVDSFLCFRCPLGQAFDVIPDTSHVTAYFTAAISHRKHLGIARRRS